MERLAALSGPVRGGQFFKRSRRGLYAGKKRLTGNNVSFSQRKTKRVWLPNTHWKKLYSDTLGQHIRFRVTAHALRCIDKAGGLDNYLVNTSDEKLDSDVALVWRQRILQTQQLVDLLEEAKVEAAGGAEAAV